MHDRQASAGDRSRADVRLTQRPRRLRRTAAMRDLVAESHLRVDDLIAPLFVREGIDEPQPIVSLPGVVQHTRSSLRTEVAELAELGVRSVILFGVPETKDAVGSGAYDPDGVVQVALRDLRADLGDDIVVMADLCVDEYTDHGHCGIVDEHGVVDNDATLGIYAQAAVAQARAGAHVVAPSGMMDGQVAAIRCALDAEGHHDVAILAYAAKYASALYGPFRDAVDVTIVGGGDRKGYQQDWRNAREARREIDARHRRGRRHGDGQAGARVPRRDRRRRRAHRRPARGVPRQRRVRDDPRRRRAGLDRRRCGGPRASRCDQARRSRHRAHVLHPVVRRRRAPRAGFRDDDRRLRPDHVPGRRLHADGVHGRRRAVEPHHVRAVEAGHPGRGELVDPSLQGGRRRTVRRRAGSRVPRSPTSRAPPTSTSCRATGRSSSVTPIPRSPPPSVPRPATARRTARRHPGR